MTFHSHKAYKTRPRLFYKVFKIVIITFFALALILLGLMVWFKSSLEAPSTVSNPIEITIEEGETVGQIAGRLESLGIIKSSLSLRVYTRLNHADEAIQAGTYSFDTTESSKRVLSRLISGDVSQNFITFVPGSRLKDIKQVLIERGYSAQAADVALKRSTYNDHPLVAEYLPDNADLEGYLYPDTYAASKNTPAGELVRSALDEMYATLTPAMKASFAEKGLSVHEAIILASVIEKEVSDPEERSFVAQVFLKRLDVGMALESNATDNYPSSYDTYSIQGLPPGPLSNVGETSLRAVAEPASSDYLFFVTGNDCKTRFSNTLAEHEQLQREYGVGCQ